MPKTKGSARPAARRVIQERTAIELPAVAEPSTALERVDPARSRLPASAVYMGNNVNTAARFALILFQSGNAGKGVTNAETVFLKCMRGLELGIGPIEAQAELHAIDGKIGCSGKLLLKKIREAGVRHEWLESTDEVARIRITTREGEAFEDEFTIADAERAELLAKKGSNYLRYPKRMLRWRALSFVVNGNVPELVGGGMLLAEELGATVDPLSGAVLALPEQAPRPVRAQATEITKAAKDETNGAGSAPAPGPLDGDEGKAPTPVPESEPARESAKRIGNGETKSAAPGVVGAIRRYAVEAGLWDATEAAVAFDDATAGNLGFDRGAGIYSPSWLADQVNADEIIRKLQEIAAENKDAAEGR